MTHVALNGIDGVPALIATHGTLEVSGDPEMLLSVLGIQTNLTTRSFSILPAHAPPAVKTDLVRAK